MKIRIIHPIVTFLIASSSLFCLAQKSDNLPVYDAKNIDGLIQYNFVKAVLELNQSLGSKSDPYGLRFGAKVSITKPGGTPELYANMPFSALEQIAQQLIAEQRFTTFNFDKNINRVQLNGIWILAAGLGSESVTNNTQEFNVGAVDYDIKISRRGVIERLTIQTYAIAVGKSPTDGTIQGELNWYADGGYSQWNNSWGPDNAKVAYKRVGPGNDSSNSELGKDIERSVSGYKVVIENQFNPGYYLPIVSHRGCKQDFTNYEKYSQMEAIVELETKLDWSQLITDHSGKVVPASTLKASNEKAKPIQSNYSKKNTIEGTIYDAEGKKMEKIVTVCLERQFNALFPKILERDSESDGTYKFLDVESGVYHVYVKETPEQFELAEVCNDPLKGEGPNERYVVDIHSQTDLVFLIECIETYKEHIEPLVLEGTTGQPGKVNSKMIGYSVVRIQNKEITDFFEPEYICNVIGAPAEDKSKVESYNSEKYSFDPGDDEGDGWYKSVKTKADFHGSPQVTYFYPEKPLNGKLQNSDCFVFDSIWTYNSIKKKYQDKKFEVFLGAAYIEGKVMDQEVISHREAHPVTFGELKRLSDQNSGTITRTQHLELKSGYNNNYVGLGTFSPQHNEFANLMADFMESPTTFYNALFPPDAYLLLPPEMVAALKSEEAKRGQPNMAVFMRTAYGKNKYSGFFESWASRITIDRSIRIRPISPDEAEKYLTSGKAFEIKQRQADVPPDPDEIKDFIKGMFGTK
jgi:hypothetical protein